MNNLEVYQRSNLFFIDLGRGKKAYVKYSMDGNVVVIESTYTPEEYRGQGLAAKITERVISYAKEKGVKIRPACSYATRFFKEHPEYEDVLG